MPVRNASGRAEKADRPSSGKRQSPTSASSAASATAAAPQPGANPELDIAPEKVCFVIIKSREFHAKVDIVESDPGSNPSDEGFREVLEDYLDDPTYDEAQDLHFVSQ